jgi:outer membrane receptor protein involved in Fe transport
MNRKLLASAICASLLVAGTAYAQQDNTAPQQSQDQSTTTQTGTASSQDQQQKKKKTLQAITVTGSLIPQSEIETVNPVVTITAEDLQKQGFKNVYDALRSLPTANGAVLDSQFTNGFTPGANTVSLLGLDPSFTLVLVNGRPLADYPLLYNANSNFVDLGTIPTMLVDRIEIVPGNQSAIYGSAAIAGVINIILKQRMEGVTLDYRAGGYTEGGGQQQRLQIAGGHSFGKLDFIGAVELNKQNPIFLSQRKIADSYLDNPNPTGRVAERDRVAIDPFTGTYVTPPDGAATCQAIGGLFGGTEKYSSRPVLGNYCGSLAGIGYGTILNKDSQANFYGKATYQLNDNTQLYADLLYNFTKVKLLVGGTNFWANGIGPSPTYIFDLDSGHFEHLQHILAPEETSDLVDPITLESSYVFDAGIKGVFGDSNWNYDAYFHRSWYETRARDLRPLADKVDAFYLGPQDGTDPYGYGYPAYHITQNGHFWGAITPSDYRSYSDFIRSDSTTYTQEGNITVTNTDLFNLPAGPVGFAGVLAAGNQYWNNPVDPRVLAGEFWGTGGTSGKGTRDYESAAIEFNIPIFKMLTADISGRYDRYAPDGGTSDSKVTYKFGLEFRPLDTLLFRANYATAFRAPDMGFVFSKGSKFFTGDEDYYNCRRLYGNDPANCLAPYDNVQFTGTQGANPNLKYITAKSWGYGVVWSPTKALTLKSDYYHIKIADEVNSFSIDQILQQEANCRLGVTVQGTPIDINSPSCQGFISQVSRTPFDAAINPGTIQNVATLPINVSRESVSGIQASGQYRWDWGRYGDFSLGLQYSVQTSHQRQTFPGDPIFDVLRTDFYGNQFKDIGTAVLDWDIGKWSTTVEYQRYGKTFNFLGNGTVGPWMKYNATIQYHVTPDINVTLIGNNIFDAMPPKDNTFSAAPFYDLFSYNAFGRLVMLELNVHFPTGG